MSEDTYKVLPAIIILSSLFATVAICVVCITKYGLPSFSLFSSFPNLSSRYQNNTTENTLRYLQSRTRPLIQTPEILVEEPIRLLPLPLIATPIILPTEPISPSVIWPQVPVLNNEI